MSAASPCNASHVRIMRHIKSTEVVSSMYVTAGWWVAWQLASHLKQQKMNFLRPSVRCSAYLQCRYGSCQMLVTAQSCWSQCRQHEALRKAMEDKCYTAAWQCHTCSTHSLATAAGSTSSCASESAKPCACINKVCLDLQAIDLCNIFMLVAGAMTAFAAGFCLY